MKYWTTDALVIGSGFGAAPLAMHLAEAGVQVMMIEKGPAINPYRDFKQTQNPDYLLRYLKTLHGRDVSLNYVEGEGGGSGFYEMMSFRAPSEAFLQTSADGKALWPESVHRKALNPYYEVAEAMLNVHQIPEAQVPKNGQIFALMMKNLGYSTDRISYAVKHCLDCGRCLTGCIYGAKQSLLLTYLPRAKEAGMQFFSETEALHIEALSAYNASVRQKSIDEIPYRYKVSCRMKDQTEVAIKSKLLILAAGTIGTAKILLQSRDYLQNLSSHVGNHISFNGSVKTASLLPKWCPDGDLFAGRSQPGVMSFEFFKSHGVVLAPAKPMPLQIFGGARIKREKAGEFGYWGADHLELMEKLRHRMMFIIAFGNLPSNGKLVLGKNGRLRLSYKIKTAEKKFYETAGSLTKHIIDASGGEILDLELMGRDGLPQKGIHFASSHQLGSCRMAESPEDGVVDPDGEVFGYPGMFISDGSILPGSLTIGPSLTILANAERIADTLMTRMNLHSPETSKQLAERT